MDLAAQMAVQMEQDGPKAIGDVDGFDGGCCHALD
jgi:hypothetical protein